MSAKGTAGNRPPRRPPMEPVAEEYEYTTEAVPYRGAVYHGINPPVEKSDVPAVFDPADEQDTPYTPLAIVPDPVPVYIVHEGMRRQRNSFRVHRSYATTNSRILGASDTTTRVTIQNLGTQVLYVGDTEETALKLFGYPVAVNGSIQICTQGTIFASSANGTQQPVSVLQEYVIEV